MTDTWDMRTKDSNYDPRDPESRKRAVLPPAIQFGRGAIMEVPETLPQRNKHADRLGARGIDVKSPRTDFSDAGSGLPSSRGSVRLSMVDSSRNAGTSLVPIPRSIPSDIEANRPSTSLSTPRDGIERMISPRGRVVVPVPPVETREHVGRPRWVAWLALLMFASAVIVPVTIVFLVLSRTRLPCMLPHERSAYPPAPMLVPIVIGQPAQHDVVGTPVYPSVAGMQGGRSSSMRMITSNMFIHKMRWVVFASLSLVVIFVLFKRYRHY